MNRLVLSLLINVAIITLISAQDFISKTIEYDGLNREYSIYVPASYDGTIGFPLVFNFHGGNDVIANWQKSADMRAIADTADFILVYPQARPDPSDGNSLNWLPKTKDTFDDVPFISSLIDQVASNYQIDQNRIYACGYSLGGEFSYELACKLNSKIAAIGAVARTMQANPEDYCSPVHPTGIMTILGTDDPISPYNGLTWAGVEYYISATETHNYWATHNNCNPVSSMTIVSPSVERHTWNTASGCAYVEELKVLGGGHDWPGSFGNMTIDASEEIWNFVSRYDLDGIIACTTTSIQEQDNSKKSIQVFPNPFKQELNVAIKYQNDTEYKIYNLMGDLVLSGRLNSISNRLDLASLSPNLYILIIENIPFKIVKAN